MAVVAPDCFPPIPMNSRKTSRRINVKCSRTGTPKTVTVPTLPGMYSGFFLSAGGTQPFYAVAVQINPRTDTRHRRSHSGNLAPAPDQLAIFPQLLTIFPPKSELCECHIRAPSAFPSRQRGRKFLEVVETLRAHPSLCGGFPDPVPIASAYPRPLYGRSLSGRAGAV